MKIFYSFTILMLIALNCVFALMPQAINYQVMARDPSGKIIASNLITLRLSIISGSTTGSTLYVETHSKTTDAFGLFSLQIGQGTIVPGLFNYISWGRNSYYCKVETDQRGGNIINNGGATVTASGICYSTITNLTTANKRIKY